MDMKRLKPFVITTFLILLITLSSCSTTSKLQKIVDHNYSVEHMMGQIEAPEFESTYPTFYQTGYEWHKHSLDLIAEAEDYILISTFLGVEHPAVFPVWKALSEKAASGVDVYIIIDSSSNFQMVPFVNERIKAAFMQLKELNLNFVEYNSLSTSNIFLIPNLLTRDHRKYWIIDGKKIAVGGVNVNQTSVDYPSGYGNTDTMIELTSPGATRELIDTFVETWNKFSSQSISSNNFSVDPNLEGETTKLWFVNHRWPTNSKVATMFDTFATYAEKELWLVQGYTFLTPKLLKRIEFAISRGVEVNIMLSEYSTQPKYEMASRWGVLDLIKAGANVYIFDSPVGSFLHSKMIVADGKLVTVGSANYNFRSETLSLELNFVFEDQKIGQEVLDYIDELLKESRLVTIEEAESFRTFRTWYNHLLMQIWG